MNPGAQQLHVVPWAPTPAAVCATCCVMGSCFGYLSPSQSHRSPVITAVLATLMPLCVRLQLFQLHRAGMVGRGVVELMHVSKAAGTSMCKLAGGGYHWPLGNPGLAVNADGCAAIAGL